MARSYALRLGVQHPALKACRLVSRRQRHGFRQVGQGLVGRAEVGVSGGPGAVSTGVVPVDFQGSGCNRPRLCRGRR